MHALIFRLGSVDVTAFRLTAWILGGALSGLIYILARKILKPVWAVVVVAPFPLICYPLAYRVSHHWWANAFLLLAVIALGKSLPQEPGDQGKSPGIWCGLAGGLAGMTLLSMQSKGFWVILTGAAFLFVEPRLIPRDDGRMNYKRALRRVSLFGAGAVVVLGLMAGYFASRGALAAWVDANLIFLFTNYRTYLDVPQASAIQTLLHIGRLTLSQPSVHFVLYFLGYAFFFFLAPVVAFGGSIARFIADRHNPPMESSIVLLLLFLGVGAFISEFHSPDIVHLMWASPLLLILFGYQWERLYSSARSLKRPLQVAGVSVIALILFAAARKAVNTSRIDGKVETRRGVLFVQPDLAAAAQARFNAIQMRVPPGGETFFYPYMAELYFLTATRNPTRYDVLLADFHRPTQIEEAIASIERSHPAYVFGFDRIQLLTIRPHFPDDLPDMIRPHPVGRALAAPGSGYQLETTVEEMEVWAANP